MANIKPRLFKGTRDCLPAEMRRKEKIISIFKAIFLRYGFEPLETPAIERYDLLTGKYGDDAEKLIYRIDYKGGREVALRYDLTVSLARVVSMYPELGLPFKRYQMQPVWRADRHSTRQGRYREFVQCDVDCVGSSSILADAELIAILYEAFDALGFKNIRIRINDRQLLSGIILGLDVADGLEEEVCRSIDKLDKIGPDGVHQELTSKGVAEGTGRRILELLDLPGDREEKISALEREVGSRAETVAGIGNIRSLFRYVSSLGVPENVLEFDPHLARGLDYYTGPIYETTLGDLPHLGSLSGGGRYDRMIGELTGRDIPATGTTLGLDRITSALDQLEETAGEPPATRLLVTVFNEDLADAALELAAFFRHKGGLAVEVFPGAEKLGRQFAYADRKGIPLVVVAGPDEIAAGQVNLKVMTSGEQHLVPRDELIDRVRELLNTLP